MLIFFEEPISFSIVDQIARRILSEAGTTNSTAYKPNKSVVPG